MRCAEHLFDLIEENGARSTPSNAKCFNADANEITRHLYGV